MKTNISTFQSKIEVTSVTDSETLPDATGSTINKYQTFWTAHKNEMQGNGNKGTDRPVTQKNENISDQRNPLSNCFCRNHPFMEAYSRTVSK